MLIYNCALLQWSTDLQRGGELLGQTHRLGSRLLLQEDWSWVLTTMYYVTTNDAVTFLSRTTQAICIAEVFALTHLQRHAHPGFIFEILHILVIVGWLHLLLLRHKLLL